MRHSALIRCGLASASAVFLFTGISTSLQAEVLEEVVVTAQKREENLQDVPVSVTAFTGDATRALGFTNSVDIAAQTPALNIGTPVGEGNNPSLVLRGVGLNDFNDNNESPVAMYRDDVYISAMAGQTFQMFDLQRVEVLRGPQGTLYGRNATGGLVHFISNKPTEEFNGYADLTLAQYNQIKFEGAVGGALGSNLQGRVAIASNQHDGYVDNRIGPDANESGSTAGRVLLNIDASDKVSVLLNAHGGSSDVVSPKYQHEVTSGGPVDFYGYADTDNDNFAGDYDRKGVLNIDTSGASATVNWDADSFVFTSITGVENLDKKHQEDTDMGPLPGIEPTFQSDAEQFSQEFRLNGSTDRSKWVAGLYYFTSDVKGQLDLDVRYPGSVLADPALLGFDPSTDVATFGPGSCSPDFPALECVYPFLNYDVDYKQETTSTALFGQWDYDLTESNTLTVGLRYTTEERKMDYFNAASLPLVAVAYDAMDFTPGTVGSLSKIDNDNVSGTLGVDHRFDDNTMIFAKVSRGFKSGGFNAGFLDVTDGLTAEDVPYDEEILTSYEVGTKLTFPDSATRLNATLFYYDYNDFQALSFSGLSQFITNSDATVYGLDAELFSSPVEGLDVVLGLSLLHTNVDEIFDRNTSTTIKDREMVLAPEVSANGLVRYAWPQWGGSVAVQADFNYQGEHFFDITNSDLAKESAYTVWNARTSYTTSDERTEVALFIKNLTDEEYRVYTFDFTNIGGFNQQFFAPPRWIGASVIYRFGS